MEVILNQFIKSLIDSRLMTADEVDEFVDALPAEKKPEDGAELAKELVRQGKLTKFQGD